MFIPSAYHTNPDGTQLTDIIVNLGNRGRMEFSCRIDRDDPDSKYKFMEAEKGLTEYVKAITDKPQLPKFEPPKTEEPPSDDPDAVNLDGLKNVLEHLNKHSEKELHYLATQPALDDIFTHLVQDRLTQSGLTLQDRIHTDGHREPAVKIIESEPVISTDNMTRLERLQQDSVKKTILSTKRHYENGKPADHLGVAVEHTKTIQNIWTNAFETNVTSLYKCDHAGGFSPLQPEEKALHIATAFSANRYGSTTIQAAGYDMPGLKGAAFELPNNKFTPSKLN